MTGSSDSPWLRCETGEPADLEGELREQSLFDGSKSEHSAPILVTEDGALVRVMIDGDNPFTHDLLRPHLGQRVSVRGTWRRGVVRVAAEDLKVLEAAAEETLPLEAEDVRASDEALPSDSDGTAEEFDGEVPASDDSEIEDEA